MAESTPTVSTTARTGRRTVPVRLEPVLHHQVVLMARLAGLSVNDLIRTALEDKLAALQQDPQIRERAADLQQAIAKDAQAQADALAGLLAAPAAEPTTRRKTTPTA